jgi:hypothetical protein
MISTSQMNTILERAYVPEHVTDYVTAVSGAEPFLLGDFLVYRKENHLIFVGYPLSNAFNEQKIKKALDEAVKRFNPYRVSLTAPCIPASLYPMASSSSDQYYRLELPSLSISQKVRNMLRHAERLLKVERQETFDEEHEELVREFLEAHPVSPETRFIFERIPGYVASTGTVWVFDARNERGDLVAFDVAEMGPEEYAFYMFNFTSLKCSVPGASDLLFHEIIRQAQRDNKRYINLGLGINPGVTFFKKKWGGRPFLPYTFVDYEPAGDGGLEGLFQKL